MSRSCAVALSPRETERESCGNHKHELPTRGRLSGSASESCATGSLVGFSIYVRLKNQKIKMDRETDSTIQYDTQQQVDSRVHSHT